MQPIAFSAALLALLVLPWSSYAGDIISSSKLEACVADGSQAAAGSLKCSQKMVVSLTVDSGDSVQTSQVQFSLSCIGSPTGACPCPCNYATDPSCSCRDLQQSLSVSLTKSPLWASYPLTYLQSFNWKPYEAVVRPGPGNCRDGTYETTPTCGWYYKAGQKIADSQGFCCECDSTLIWDATFGNNKVRTRANLDCDFFSNPLDILLGKRPSSAHCLKFDDQWYGGYGLGSASLQFDITASLTMGNATTGANITESLTLSPSVPLAASGSGVLIAKLLGDLAGYMELPVLSPQVLMVPQPLAGQSLESVLTNQAAWMLVDKSRISFEGGDADKVGTSFAAFRYQASGCARGLQSGLANQLKDLYLLDQARVATGKAPLYLVSQYAYGTSSSLRAFGGGPLSFALPVTAKRSSVVTLEAVADSMRLVVNASPGNISVARMCQFSSTKCGGFEALAAHGYLLTNVTNTGVIPAAFTLSVTNCSVSIRRVEAQKLGLLPGVTTAAAPFEIYVEDATAVKGRYCWLMLYDSQAHIVDSVRVDFYTNATLYDLTPSGGLAGNGSGEGTAIASQSCDTSCSNSLDVLCFVARRCWSKLGGLLGVLGGGLALVGLLILAYKFGWIQSLCSCCCSALCGSNNKKPTHDDKGSASTERHRDSGRRYHDAHYGKDEWQQQHKGAGAVVGVPIAIAGAFGYANTGGRNAPYLQPPGRSMAGKLSQDEQYWYMQQPAGSPEQEQQEWEQQQGWQQQEQQDWQEQQLSQEQQRQQRKLQRYRQQQQFEHHDTMRPTRPEAANAQGHCRTASASPRLQSNPLYHEEPDVSMDAYAEVHAHRPMTMNRAHSPPRRRPQLP